jgi:hypothetical protein
MYIPKHLIKLVGEAGTQWVTLTSALYKTCPTCQREIPVLFYGRDENAGPACASQHIYAPSAILSQYNPPGVKTLLPKCKGARKAAAGTACPMKEYM